MVRVVLQTSVDRSQAEQTDSFTVVHGASRKRKPDDRGFENLTGRGKHYRGSGVGNTSEVGSKNLPLPRPTRSRR